MLAFLPLLLLVLAQGSALNFLAIGDWGGTEEAPYYTDAQLKSAGGMDKVASKIDAAFFLAVGDNFYHDGVTSLDSSRFRDTFENVYSGAALQKDWFAVAGNHDYRGNVSAQIAYTAESARWKFPAPYYAKQFVGSDGAVLDMVFIDTVELSSASKALSESDPTYFDPLPLLSKSAAPDQWTWIEDQMKASTADHLLVVGHYPVYSNCEHGPTPTLIEHLRPLLKQYRAHYLSGHDHCMEHLADEDGVNYFLSGMGVECCYRSVRHVPKDYMKWYIAHDNKGDAVSGFTSFQVSKDALTATFYDHEGSTLYTTPSLPSRKH